MNTRNLNFLNELCYKNGINLQKTIDDRFPRILFPKLVQYETEDQFHELLDELIQFLKNKGKLQEFARILKDQVLSEISSQHKHQIDSYLQSYHYKHPDFLALKDFLKKEFFVPIFTLENCTQFKNFSDYVYRLNLPINPSLVFRMKEPSQSDIELALKSFVDMFEKVPIQLDKEWAKCISIDVSNINRGVADSPLDFLSEMLQIFQYNVMQIQSEGPNSTVYIAVDWDLWHKYISEEFLKKHLQKFCEDLDADWVDNESIASIVAYLIDKFFLDFTKLKLKPKTIQALINIYLDNVDLVQYKAEQLNVYIQQHFSELTIKNKIKYFYQVFKRIDILELSAACNHIFNSDYYPEIYKHIKLSLINELISQLNAELYQLDTRGEINKKQKDLISKKISEYVIELLNLGFKFNVDFATTVLQSLNTRDRKKLLSRLVDYSVDF